MSSLKRRKESASTFTISISLNEVLEQTFAEEFRFKKKKKPHALPAEKKQIGTFHSAFCFIYGNYFLRKMIGNLMISQQAIRDAR